MDKVYKHRDVEKKWYSLWEKSGYFKPEINPKKSPFVITMPPPNANGELHIGHAMFIVIEDILIRYHRMKGDPTLWLPGADHAGILTQVVFEKELAKKGKTRFDLGREEFFKQAYGFSMKNKKHMELQLKRLGASCDWSREKFTLDPQISKAVYLTFKNLYDDGLIYRGERIINWCSRCGTALSELEVEHEKTKGKLWYIKYPLKKQKAKFITVATTRPETMLGDTAVAVNPQDKRYKNLIGKTTILPLINREIPIIGDEKVEKEFGTGAVKVTPFHDPVDFEIGNDHNLPRIQVIGLDGKMTKEAGKYHNLKTQDAREKVLKGLKEKDHLEKIEDYEYAISKCERCRSIVEPLVSKQWFVKIKPLAQEAIKVVRQGKIKILPKRFEKIYFNWMENIRDWCISRQIWWGHRLPVYYCMGLKNEKCKKEDGAFVSIDTPKFCPLCKSKNFAQDADTLDTWFSSGQWPYTTLGWPKKTKDFQYFYPTSVMETGYDILFFWVARMIMFGLYSTGKIPFHTIFLHGLVRDEHGKKMSKSKGNVIDPLTMADKYGTDAIRNSLIFGSSPGNDLNLGEDKIRGMRNFSNKIWNMARFIVMNFEKTKKKVPNYSKAQEKNLLEDDKKIIEGLEALGKKVTNSIESYRFSDGFSALYDFLWHEFADKYIEATKKRLEEKDTIALCVLRHVFLSSLKLLHPFMPFITEELWSKIPKEESDHLIITKWPQTN